MRQLTRLLELAVILLMAALTLDVLWGVITRLVLQSPSRWTEEVATFLLIWVSLLGSAVAFARREHLGLDYFVQKLHPSAQRIAAMSAQIVIILFSVIALIYGGYILVSETLAAGQVTPAMGVRKGYIYLCVPLAGSFFVLFAASDLFRLWSSDPRLPSASATPTEDED